MFLPDKAIIHYFCRGKFYFDIQNLPIYLHISMTERYLS